METRALQTLDREEELITGDNELFGEDSDVLAYESDRLLYSARVIEVKEDKKDSLVEASKGHGQQREKQQKQPQKQRCGRAIVVRKSVWFR